MFLWGYGASVEVGTFIPDEDMNRLKQ
jgi:hypothetical protein